MKPDDLAQEAKKLEKLGVKVTIYDKKAIEKIGLTALLAVNRGGVNEPRFVIMEYNGGGKKKVALVGKGITFDSGGLDIKTADGMLTMKEDMAGAATVLATVKAAALLKLKVHVVGVFAATENMLGMDPYKPGDVVIAYNGKTIEIANTDAEGRVILSDALAYTEKMIKPDAMVDIATLTGAVSVALGHVCAGVMGTETKLIDHLIMSGNATGERLWPFPFYSEYHEMVKSDIADVQNIGKIPRSAGSIMGGAFLAAFVEKTPWAHIDIAGVSWSNLDAEYVRKGGTGFGVRLLVHALEHYV
jgi:leucyl aminopeptidase